MVSALQEAPALVPVARPFVGMSIRMDRKALLQALTTVARVAPGKNKTKMPMLSHTRIRVVSSWVEFVATDLDVAVRVEMQAGDVGVEYGEVCVDARALHSMVKGFTADIVAIKQLGAMTVEVTCGSAKATMIGATPDDFPTIPELDAVRWLQMDAVQLANMLGRTFPFVSQDETRFVLNGVLVEDDGLGSLGFTSTDGHRLSRVVDRVPDAGWLPSVILPAKGVKEMLQLANASDKHCPGDVQIGFRSKKHEESASDFISGKIPSGKVGDAGHCIVKRANVTLIMRLIEGRFPDYAQVIPQSRDRRLTIPRKLLLAALKRLGKEASVKLSLTHGELLLQTDNPDTGAKTDSVPSKLEGDGLRIGFNLAYLVAAVDSFSADLLHLSFTDELSPVLLQNADGDGPEYSEGYKHVIMPMRI